MENFDKAREEMVDRQVAARGVADPAVLDAMRKVPREAFIPEPLRANAYKDSALPIEAGQTISQPYIVALMIEAADIGPQSRVLEVGAGSGYAAAVMGEIVGEVFAIERHKELAALAQARMAELGYGNVTIRHADGTKGWPEQAPFDAILVAAAGAATPEALKDQLATGGRLVIPVGGSGLQMLMRYEKRPDGSLAESDLGAVRFVPLVEGVPSRKA